MKHDISDVAVATSAPERSKEGSVADTFANFSNSAPDFSGEESQATEVSKELIN